MHFEFLVEDSSTTRLLGHLLPKLIGRYSDPHTWELHSYRGNGRIPPGLEQISNPAQRLLLSRLPKLLAGYAKKPGYDAIVVVCDTDRQECDKFLTQLRAVASDAGAEAITMFRLAIEETEAWYLGDRDALLKAYPKAKKRQLDAYSQDSVCDTWERLADIVHPRGSRVVHDADGPTAGDLKHEMGQPHRPPHGPRPQPLPQLRQTPRRTPAPRRTTVNFPNQSPVQARATALNAPHKLHRKEPPHAGLLRHRLRREPDQGQERRHHRLW
jgi:hypothetical protein